MNFKKFSTSDNQWHDVPYYQHKTATDTLTLPAVIYPNDTSITVGIKGQSSQASIPTPQNPVMPNGTGDMSSNILTVYKEKYSINASGVETYNDVAMIYKASVSVASSTFVLSFGGLSEGDAVRIHAYTGDTWKEQIAAIAISQVPVSFTVSSDVDNIRVSIRKTATDVTLTDGQFKIPILSGNTTTTVYLGETQSTRRIKKYEFTGQENFQNISSDASIFGVYGLFNEDKYIPLAGAFSTHYKYITNQSDLVNVMHNNDFVMFKQSEALYNIAYKDTLYSDRTDFKAYLAAQYSAGTPVCVWYVLAEPETGIVNEPLRKIGDYADSLTTSIPCTAGENTLDVQTTVQPSEVTAGFSGWHPVQSVHERENGQWD